MAGFNGLRAASVLCVASLLVGASLSSQAAGHTDRGRYIVAFKPGHAAAAGARAAIGRAGGRVVLDLDEVRAVTVELPHRAVAALQRHAHVEFVEEDSMKRALALVDPSGPPYQPGQLVPYGIKMVQANQVSDDNAANRTLCIVDSGIDGAHEDLNGIPMTGENLTKSGSWDTDELQHGTHVAGTVAAINNTGVGVVGVAPNMHLNLYIAKVFDESGEARTSVISRAMLNCRRNGGANVISLSLGGPGRMLEQRVVQFLAKRGILLVAAAGNSGTSTIEYPAGYPEVVSVAAVDIDKAHASFSQTNADVELAAPGVEVYSTVPMNAGQTASVIVGATPYAVLPMEGSPNATASGPLADFGLGNTPSPGSMAGKVCLIQRGEISFGEKVLNCQTSGGVGAIVYNNEPGNFDGTLGDVVTTIPSVSASDTDGAAMKTQLGEQATVSVSASSYAYKSGTSMSTPHVSAVAAVVWSHHTGCTAEQIRDSLNKSAEDLGAAGRDPQFGYGLVLAKAAHDRIGALGCGE